MGETNKTLERVANGVSTEDIRHKLTDVADKLPCIEQSGSSLDWDEKDYLKRSAEIAVKLCQKIGTTGMDTVGY